MLSETSNFVCESLRGIEDNSIRDFSEGKFEALEDVDDRYFYVHILLLKLEKHLLNIMGR